MVTAVALLLLLNDKCKPESLQRDGIPGWRFPQTAGCKARTCFVDILEQCGPNTGMRAACGPPTLSVCRILHNIINTLC